MPFGLIGSLFSGIAGMGMNMMNLDLQNQVNHMNVQHQNYWNERNLEYANTWNERNIAFQGQTNTLNRQLVRDVNESQIALQHQAWNREDNSVQRRMADLKQAGINPILAAGQGAQASGPISLNTPRDEAPQGRMQASGQAARMEAYRMETDIVERALRMRDDFATNAATRRVLEATAEEHRARADEIKQNVRFASDSYETRLNQIKQDYRIGGHQEVLKNLQVETERLSQQGIISRNHGQVLSNIERELENRYITELRDREISQADLSIASQTIANEIAEHNKDTYLSLGTPTTGNVAEKAVMTIWNMGRKFFNWIKDIGPTASEPNRGVSGTGTGFGRPRLHER